MMNLLIVGDGPLARELAERVENDGHEVTALFLDGAPAGLDLEQEEGLEPFVHDKVDIAIEAVVSEPTDKWDAVTELDRLLPSDVVILTAALNASATEVSSWCRYPGRVVGFASLPPLANATVVEFMPALQSSEDAREKGRAFWRTLELEPVEIKDSVGGVIPRVVCNIINEAAFALTEDVATPSDIDQAMQLGTSYPRGPLAWADLIRLDQVVAILEALGNEFGPDKYRPAPLLRQYARAGKSFY